LIFDVVPADTDAEAQPPTAQHIDFRRLLGDKAGLALRGGEERKGREGFVERIFFGVDRLPIATRGGAEDMIGYLDMVIAEVFGGLRPIADFCRIIANRAGREKSAEFHWGLVSVGA